VGIQIGWKVDSNACMSCRACELACKTEFGIQAGQGRRRRVIEKTIIDAGDKVRTFFLSLACNHCENPACVAACPDETRDAAGHKALWKDEDGSSSNGVVGVVHVDPMRCIGCRRCEWACPYGAPQFNPESEKIHKCELCYQRFTNTKMHQSKRVPACVAQCPGQSIKADWVDTDPSAEYNFTPTDRLDILGAGDDLVGSHGVAGAENDHQLYTTGPTFAAPGSTDAYQSRGTKYVADAALTRPALKIRNRVYVNRDGSGLE